jgi:hypothetical protein
MTLDPDELAAQIEETQAFIASDPTTVILIPRVRVNSPTGAKFIDQAARPAQVFKILPSNLVSGSGRPLFTLDGIERTVDFELMGMPGVQVARYDYWIEGPDRFEVIDVAPFNQYQVKASVERRG